MESADVEGTRKKTYWPARTWRGLARVMSAFSNLFSSKILTSTLFYREIPIRAAISMVHSEPAIIRRMIDGCEKSKGARCKKIATIIMTVKAI